MKDKTIVVLTHELFEDLELWYPVHRLREEGARVLLAGPEKGVTYKGKHGVPATTDIAIRDIDANGIDGLVIPGGYAPDKLRRMPETTALVKHIERQGREACGHDLSCRMGACIRSYFKGRKVTRQQRHKR
ncbi:MAG: DJ-1/PfpI family protein [Bacteroidales bacterium]|nr:DJ-1/PfpI family protein [Bacteroidales bacterium]